MKLPHLSSLNPETNCHFCIHLRSLFSPADGCTQFSELALSRKPHNAQKQDSATTAVPRIPHQQCPNACLCTTLRGCFAGASLTRHDLFSNDWVTLSTPDFSSKARRSSHCAVELLEALLGSVSWHTSSGLGCCDFDWSESARDSLSRQLDIPKAHPWSGTQSRHLTFRECGDPSLPTPSGLLGSGTSMGSPNPRRP